MDSWKELIGDFLEEAYSLLDSFEESLLDLEKDLSNKTGIDTIFRVAHTLKGGAGAVGFDNITKLTHIMEDVLDLVRKGRYTFTNQDVSLLLEIKDELDIHLKAYEQEKEHPFDKASQLIHSLEQIKQQVLNPDSVTTTSQAKPDDVGSKLGFDPSDSPYDIDKLPIAARFGITQDILFSLQEALNFDEKLLFIEIRFNENYELKEVGPFEVLTLVNDLSEPIVMNPDLELIEEDYFPYLNIVIPCKEDINYIQQKLSLPDVTSKVTVRALDSDLLVSIEQNLNGIFMDIGTTPATTSPIQAIPAPSISSEPEEASPIIEISSEESKEESPTDNSEKATKKEEKRSPSLKVESSRIDELLNLLGELVIIRSGLSQFGAELEKSIYNMRLTLRNFITSSAMLSLHEDPEINKIRNDQFRNDFSITSNSIDNYIEYTQQLSRISSTLQSRMMNLRMVPVQTVFSRFTRLTRDIAKQLNKKIELVIEGGETEIDKGMIDDLYDPLMHMIRNSLDHGIESPQDRIATGKPETGTIQLKAYQEGDAIFIEIMDDGKGIDSEKIAQKAVEKGFVSEAKVATLSPKEKTALILLPGFSTVDQVSNLSGRGVGMDVVNRNIQELGGSVSINSELGRGTLIRIKLPLTLAIIQGLLILIEKVHYVIPISSVEETIILNPSLLYKLDHYYAIKFREQLIPIISLPNVLYCIPSLSECTDTSKNNPSHEGIVNPSVKLYHHYCIIVRYGNRQVGIIVPEILKEQDIVVKPLDNQIIYSPGISAATIVGNGEVGFILDLAQVIHHYLKK